MSLEEPLVAPLEKKQLAKRASFEEPLVEPLEKKELAKRASFEDLEPPEPPSRKNGRAKTMWDKFSGGDGAASQGLGDAICKVSSGLTAPGMFKSEKSKYSFMGGISFANGWMDSICLRRYHAFATMMVGNQLALGNAVGSYIYGVNHAEMLVLPNPLFYLGMIVMFMIGVFIFRLLDKKHNFQPRHFGIVLCFWMAAHDLAYDFAARWSCNPSVMSWLALSLSPVFGIQDAIMTKKDFGFLPWCTTGNMVTVADGAVKQVLGDATLQDKKKTKESAILLFFTVTGAISGATFASWREHVKGTGCAGDYGLLLMAPVLGGLFYIHDLITRPKSFSHRRISAWMATHFLETEDHH